MTVDVIGQVAGLALALMAVLLVLVYTLWTGVPPTPSGPGLRAALFRCLPDAAAGPVYELGSGWGGIALGLVARYPGVAVRAFELSPLPFAVSRLRRWMAGANDLLIGRSDLFHQPLNDAALVICYLFPGKMVRLREKLSRELAPGTLVFSLVFAIPGWTPVRVETARDLYRSKVYVYRV